MIRHLRIESPFKYEYIYEKLIQKGLSKRASVSKANMILNCSLKLAEAGIINKKDAVLLYVPGRIELLGKHTDYAGGRSILATVERGFVFVAMPRQDNKINIHDMSRVRKTSFKLVNGLIPESGHWTNYPVTVARRLVHNFGTDLKGADIAFASDLPSAAGLSSSSAMITGFFLCLAHINSLFSNKEFISNIPDARSLASYIGAIENGEDFGSLSGDEGVGTLGGNEDHTALLCCDRKHFSQYSYCPVKLERQIPLPEGYVMGIATSGVKAEKTGNMLDKYNSLSMQASVLVDIWNRHHETFFKTLNDVIASAGIELVRHTLPAIVKKSRKKTGFKSESLVKRLEHFIKESIDIVPAAGDALMKGNLGEFSRLVDQSQELSRTHLNNQVPQTIFLVDKAKELGAPAACSFSAGFGGSVWALVPVEAAIEGFFFEWANEYRKEFPSVSRHADFFSTWLGPASFRIDTE